MKGNPVTTHEKVYASAEVCAERRERLAQRLDNMPQGNFNIEVSARKESCGTVACIAGWAALQAVEEGLIELGDIFIHFGEGAAYTDGTFSWQSIRQTAATYLGFDHLDAHYDVDKDLFYGSSAMPTPTPMQAADALRHVGREGGAWAKYPVWPERNLGV
jgi:hypothetical protein